MTIPDLLKACANGKMPMVKTSRHVKYALKDEGQVVVIRTSGRRGCAVQFPGLNYDTWFNEELGTDERSRYMSELSIVE